jgi:serine/threonine protein kinase
LQILLEQRYGRAVDWWAFGVLVYEMLLGQSPFRGDDEDEIFDAILEDEPLYPITMPRDAVSILQKVSSNNSWIDEGLTVCVSFSPEIQVDVWGLGRVMLKT